MRAFFSAFWRKLISPEMAETYFTKGKTHFTNGKNHFTSSKTRISKPKNIAFSLVLLNLPSKMTQIHSKYPKFGLHLHFATKFWWEGQHFCKNWSNRHGKRKKNHFQKVETNFANGQNSFQKCPKLIFWHFTWVGVTGFRTKKAWHMLLPVSIQFRAGPIQIMFNCP